MMKEIPRQIEETENIELALDDCFTITSSGSTLQSSLDRSLALPTDLTIPCSNIRRNKETEQAEDDNSQVGSEIPKLRSIFGVSEKRNYGIREKSTQKHRNHIPSPPPTPPIAILTAATISQTQHSPGPTFTRHSSFASSLSTSMHEGIQFKSTTDTTTCNTELMMMNTTTTTTTIKSQMEEITTLNRTTTAKISNNNPIPSSLGMVRGWEDDDDDKSSSSSPPNFYWSAPSSPLMTSSSLPIVRSSILPSSSSSSSSSPPIHETRHAQCLILGLAFLAVWSPQNGMAPNLTEIAQDFGFTSDSERDTYLGANIALATGVLSLPLSAGIGILADWCNRKYLFCITVTLGALASWLTGVSPTYRMLFFARWLSGGFMSGSVPVIFSLLGDLFDTHERNAASSGLTAMMGMGIIAGQVYAGFVGSSKGWSHPFYVSSGLTLCTAVLVLFLVREPIRGAKEEALQEMIKNGTSYNRKLTWSSFLHTMTSNQSNIILISQGFFSSIPWGIIFVFLNDYLSQERGFSVPDATFLVAVFGIGCAVGGILGGYWGQKIYSSNRSHLPLFLSVTTFLGIFPFIVLLNGNFTNARGLLVAGCAFLGGFMASLPSVSVRPCLINVNPPESRGAALTLANLVIQFARGAGPSSVTALSAILKVDRQFSFNLTVSLYRLPIRFNPKVSITILFYC
jgi:predicted MFS family arabinose efflux permease